MQTAWMKDLSAARRITHLTASKRKTLLVAGAAAGMSATFAITRADRSFIGMLALTGLLGARARILDACRRCSADGRIPRRDGILSRGGQFP